MRLLSGLALLATAIVSIPAAAAAPAGAFLREAATGDSSEASLGRLASTRGASPAVRAYGRRLASDHGGHLGQVRSLARRMRIPVSAAMKPDARRLYRTLSRLRGHAFDRMFVQHMIEGHRQAIAAYEEQANSGDRQTAGFARQTLPVLREHLRIAESLAR